MPEKITVTGIKEAVALVKAVGNVDDSKEFKAAGRKITTDIVIPHAQGRAGGLGALQARAARDIRPATIAKGAALRFGGWAGDMGAEFGATHNLPRNTHRGTIRGWNEFRPHLGRTGYFLWPTIRSDEDTIVETYGQAVDALITRLSGVSAGSV